MSDTPLAKIIRQKIKDEGPMPLSEYMGLCLGHSKHGYYMTRDPFGQAGDFITAPEISQMFGEMVGAWLMDTWQKMGSPSDFILLEMGAGRGTLMSDILRVAKVLPAFLEAVHVHIVEMSPILQKAQEYSLQVHDLKNAPQWSSCIESVDFNFPVLVIGNEFLDALPVDQLVFTDAGWARKFVKIDENDTFRLYEECEYLGRSQLEKALPQTLFKPNLGDVFEVSLEQRKISDDLIKIILKQGGSILWIDYGFKSAGAYQGGDTLQAVKKHQFSDIFAAPGENDLTYHINFSDLADYALSKNVVVHGPVSQSDYLTSLGIEHRAEILKRHATKGVSCSIDAELNRLIGKDEMGDLFKVIAFTSDPNIDLAGF
ncbi:MAG: methyltransferase [Micavibrio sp.]|nr:methyltransferase [Micavibrio sp.]